MLWALPESILSCQLGHRVRATVYTQEREAAVLCTMHKLHVRDWGYPVMHLQILQAVLTDSQLRMKKENDAVFFQKPPQQLPEAPAPKRLVAPVPYALPQAAPGVKEGVASFAAAPAGAVAVEVSRACLPSVLCWWQVCLVAGVRRGERAGFLLGRLSQSVSPSRAMLLYSVPHNVVICKEMLLRAVKALQRIPTGFRLVRVPKGLTAAPAGCRSRGQQCMAPQRQLPRKPRPAPQQPQQQRLPPSIRRPRKSRGAALPPCAGSSSS